LSNTLDRNTPVVALASTSIGFAMMCVGMFMAILDVQVVATSLPTIQNALDIPPDQMSWVQPAYLIAEVVASPLTGAPHRRECRQESSAAPGPPSARRVLSG
jgi:MFS transporter, DHA2 family, multidrug resistance protein